MTLDKLNVRGGKLTFDYDGTRYTIEAEADGILGDLVVYSGRGNIGHNKVDIPKLAAWAKAGCPDWVDTSMGIPYMQLCDTLRKAGHPIDNRTLLQQLDSLVTDRDRLKARVAELEKGAKAKAKVAVRCIDCEHLKLSTVSKGRGECGRAGTREDIYRLSICDPGFTPAAEGCGSVDQALRKELARKTK